ncbi:MAG: hypothetical protein AABZ53_07420 [Planctomycetota bacterium]
MALHASIGLALAFGLCAGSAMTGSVMAEPGSGHHHGGGFSIHGSGSSGNWSWNVDIGGGGLGWAFGGGRGCSTGGSWSNDFSGYSYGSSSSYYQPAYAVRGLGPRIDPALLPGISPVLVPAQPEVKVPPPPPPTTLELAQAAMVKKNFVEAKKHYKEHLKTKSDDMEVTRQLAFCLLENKEIDDGAALLRDAYRRDPTLADRVYDVKEGGQDSTRLLTIVTQLTPYSFKSKLPSGWLAVAVAMQADGKNANALKMLERAKEGGLEREIYDRMAAALKPRPKTLPVPGTPAAGTHAPVPAAPMAPATPGVVAPGTTAPAAPVGPPLPTAPKTVPEPSK